MTHLHKPLHSQAVRFNVAAEAFGRQHEAPAVLDRMRQAIDRDEEQFLTNAIRNKIGEFTPEQLKGRLKKTLNGKGETEYELDGCVILLLGSIKFEQEGLDDGRFLRYSRGVMYL